MLKNDLSMANKINLRKASEFRMGIGCYKWWATKSDAVLILKTLGFEEKDLISLESFNGDGVDLYCVYVGSASKEDIMCRLNWHINGKNGKSHISTLRRTIAAVFGYNLYDDASISDKLCEFYVSWNVFDNNEVGDEEKRLINEFFHPLNIEYNEHKNAKKSKAKLKELRAETRSHIK